VNKQQAIQIQISTLLALLSTLNPQFAILAQGTALRFEGIIEYVGFADVTHASLQGTRRIVIQT
jgi:hypothetical protein